MKRDMPFKQRFSALLVFCLISFSSFSQVDSLLIDFGDILSEAPWNNITNPDTGFVDNLLNQRSEFSSVSITIIDDFNNINQAGTETPSPSIPFPATATGDSFFGNVATFGGQEQPTAALEISNLNPATTYSLSFFASRVASDNREGEYIVNGISQDTAYLDAASNDSVVVVVNMMPDAAGKITVNVGPGPNNTNGSNFYYLGGMIIAYENEPVVTLDTILIDFGDTPSAAPWNNISDTRAGQIDDLILTSGFSSDRSIVIFDDFNGVNTAGTTTPDSALGIPVTASGDSFYGNVAVFNGVEQPTAGLRLSNFDFTKPVEINIFASRNASDNRETQYVVQGSTSDTLLLDAASNTDQLAIATVLPKEDGTIDILVSTGPNNTNGSGFYYLGAMKVIYDADQVFTSELTLLSPVGGESWQVGKTPRIKWDSKNNPTVLVEYSTDNGNAWNEIGSYPGIDQGAEWEVPNEPTEEALVRISSGEHVEMSAGTFTITDDTTNCNIVILGSSTAEGAGSSPRDSSWVNRFASHLSQQNTKFNVINLGKGGYNTFHILPDGSEIPDGVSTNIDEERNMTKALSYSPSTIIVNMPSNDASSGFGVEMQLANFKTLYDAGVAGGANTFICTTQPRNFSNKDQLDIQSDVADSILSIYGENAIDFWSVLVAADTTILDELDSGDGIHVNNSGHFALFKQVVDKQIDTSACSSIVSIYDLPNRDISRLDVFPNPFKDEINVSFDATDFGNATILLFDNLGRKIAEKQHRVTQVGNQNITIHELGNLSNSMSMVHLQVILDAKNGKSSKVVTLVKQQ
ncbi:GDSL-type esterase/lipase family protein [Portibacter lacus]|uniref:SGNH hydrolase-type esterase domain-containing protein n=1 Tax=Portibacter lacus TaxID=1099794 RepID=A0AA37WGZ4_9BACT|nr:GDSL-type esterase/lipase family protein [Portibacter lacus]GLR18315.1 hypothetical protein GCM10007940_29310 [Portibacter lacus]